MREESFITKELKLLGSRLALQRISKEWIHSDSAKTHTWEKSYKKMPPAKRASWYKAYLTVTPKG